MMTSRQCIAIAAIFLFIGLCAFFIVPFFVTTRSSLWFYDSNTGAIGDTIGGIAGPIVGFVGVIATFLAFYIQYSANKIQFKAIADIDRHTKISNLESHFFRMLDYHNQNVSQFKVPNLDKSKTDFSEARRGFVQFKIQIKRLLSLIDEINLKHELWLSKRDVADIAYIITYYGIEGSWAEFIEPKLDKYENPKFITSEILRKIESEKSLWLGRSNQTYLSVYFRNMYNAIRLVDDSIVLNDLEKKNLIKIFRAQLSNPELYVLFFNVISRFGKKWEERNYIVKYDLLRNIPKGYCDGYEPPNFFNVSVEDEDYYTEKFTQ